MPEDFQYLNIHAAEAWHEDAQIIGTVRGLTALRDAIDHVLQAQSAGGDPRASVESMIARDGEGFIVRVACVDTKTLDGLHLPYTGKIAASEDGIWPDNLFEDIVRKEAAAVQQAINERDRLSRPRWIVDAESRGRRGPEGEGLG